MIVICSRCEARFRVADEKIGPRGAKVRCSRCQNVFIVRMPGSEGTASTALPIPAPVGADPFAAPATRGPDPFAPPPAPDPFALAAPPAGAPDPFARSAAASDPFAAVAAAIAAPPAADPFAPLAPPSDPFAPPALADPFALEPAPPAPAATPPAGDPFAVAPEDDPFATPAAPPPGNAPDGGPARASPLDADPFGAPEASSDPFAAAADPFAATVSPRRGAPRGAELLPGSPAAADPGDAGGSDLPSPDPDPLEASGGLALEDRITPGPLRPAAPDDPSLAPPPLAEPGAPFDPSEVAFQGASPTDDAPLALASEPTPGPASAALAASGFAPPSSPRPRAPVAPAAGPAAPPPESAAAPEQERIPGSDRASRLRLVAVNAVALAALLLLAAGFLVAWRGDAAGEGSGLLARAARLVGRGPAITGPLAVARVDSGRYERAAGPAVFFVRGLVTSRAPAELRAVRVEVEVVRDGQVLARGAAPLGAVPTPEELHLATDGHALDALAAALRARAPAAVAPGQTIPFLVPLPDAPDDLQGASLRVVAAAGSAP